MVPTAQSYVQTLQMQPHPEGGYFKETYRSAQVMDVARPGSAELASRNISTGIYFLLEQGNFSAFHKIRSDEMWHFYAGHALEVLELAENGQMRCTRLGPDLLHGEVFQHVVPADTWFAARVAGNGAFSLVGCTVAPGFDFADFSMADRAALLAAFPQHRQTITDLTR
ncbi:cupin domain-containing protein [Rhodoferax sp.]|uniref:cupin domain-containing protein n=1 Tax=Rhodoferax sp. TaxID=50421 RepID=UPI00284B9C1F|nr:cupin domain-containing protein [Rhodoferax sp.]MDR3369227.1 cupin domain-containing protein [Rhodoferax sp.]